MLDSFTRMTLHRVWFRNDIPKDKESLLFKREGGFSHSLDKGHFKTASFWNISFEDSGTNHAHSKLNFKKVASEILQQRIKTGPTGRQLDLMHLMLTANEDSAEKGSSKLTDEQINGRCQIFLFAGYETSSNTLAYITYQLALKQNVRFIQDKLRQEIKEAV